MNVNSRQPGTLLDTFQEQKEYAEALAETIREPVLLVNSSLLMLHANKNFCDLFDTETSDLSGRSIEELGKGYLEVPAWNEILGQELSEKRTLKDHVIRFRDRDRLLRTFLLNAGFLNRGEKEELILLSFKPGTGKKKLYPPQKDYLRSFRNILTHTPAMICTMRGPNHVFELVNDRYLQLVDYRNIVGKPVRKALPEVENQGFFEILDHVYSTEEPYVGTEVPIKMRSAEGKMKNTYVDFLYHPTWDTDGEVDGIFVFAVDVTAQVLSRKKVEESEENLRKLIDTVPAIIWISDKEGYNSYLNKNWYKYTGQRKEEAEELGWLQAVHPEDREQARESFLEANRQQISFSATYRLRNRDGFYRWVLSSGSPNYNLEGKYEGLIGAVIDVHEERMKEQEVREKELRLRNVVEEATVPTAVYAGKEMRIELANDAMIDLWGKDRKVVGTTLREALPELEGQPFFDLLEEVFHTGKTYWGKEERVDLLINGKLRTGYFNFTYKPLRNERGEIYGVLNMALDITDMVRSRNLLRKSEARFRQLADLMPEKVAKTDPEGELTYFNNAWLDYTGLPREELLQKGIEFVVHEDDEQEFKKNWQESLQKGVRFEMEFRCRSRNGSYKWHLSRAEAIRNEDGLISYWVISTTEIQKLKEEEKKKEDFLKMVSHELKTPVTSIKGYVQLLLSLLQKKENELDPSLPLKPSLERIDHQIGRLTRLISEMLDLSRIEENKLELQKKEFSINELVDETVQDISYTNTHHSIRIFHECECTVFADRDRIGQVLINFITNAIKYSPGSKEVEVKVRRTGECRVKVSVKDRGIGIDKKNHKKIFRRFYRVGKKEEDTYSGFGIGLFLANEIIQRHNGQIEVESSKGEGSTFSFTLETPF